MSRKSSTVISGFLAALIFVVLALPAWGAPHDKKPTLFGNLALVTENSNINTNLMMAMAHFAVYSSPVTAMDHLATWCGTPSADNPCLIKILPGVYELGTATLTMQPYVDIEGSGEKTTTISGAVNDSSLTGVINGADNAEIRFLTVKNTLSGSGTAVAISNKSQSPKITHVTVIASGPTLTNYGVYNANCAPSLESVTIVASQGADSYGIYNTAASPVMNNVSVSVKEVGLDAYGVYNHDSSTPTMSNVTVATNGHFSYGMYNTASAPIMRNVSVTASGLNSYGMTNLDHSAPILNDVIITALAGTNIFGIVNQDSSPTMSNVTVSASGNLSFGITNSSASPVTISVDRCTFKALQSISNGSNVAMKIGGSRIIGLVGGDGLTCTASYNGDFAPLGANCK